MSSTYPTAQTVSLEEVKISAPPQIKFHLQAQEVQQGLSESPCVCVCVCAMMYSTAVIVRIWTSRASKCLNMGFPLLDEEADWLIVISLATQDEEGKVSLD